MQQASLNQNLDSIHIQLQPKLNITLKIKQSQNLKIKTRQPWTRIENIQYSLFLIKNTEMFESKEQRKKNKVFLLLSAFLKTRTTHQVKSHHQKMVKRHKKIINIIKYMQGKFTENLTLRVAQERRQVSIQTDERNLLDEDLGLGIVNHQRSSREYDIQELQLLQASTMDSNSFPFQQFPRCFNSFADI